MKVLHIPEQQLLKVEKPAQYIGNEINTVHKDVASITTRFALCFPDIYEIGMSHLGLSILYNQLNDLEDVYCERVFSPMKDLEAIMREKNYDIFALESQDSVSDFDFLGFTLQYEMSYTNILGIMDMANMPFYAKDRDGSYPIVCGGGPCVYNPEPVAPFFDFFYIGESEKTLPEVMSIYTELKKTGIEPNERKKIFLEKLLSVEGIYVPKYYDIEYKADGTIEEMKPLHEEAKPRIKKQIISDINEMDYAKKPIVPFIQPVHDRIVLELFRGCSRGCRFCQAGFIYRPVREKSLETIREQADYLSDVTGHDEISLISLSTSDYSHLSPLCDYIIDDVAKESRMNLSLPSLRIDSFSLDLMHKVQDVRKSSLTFAPEAGSQRLRDIINKGITHEDIIKGSHEAFKGGWNRVKLYFMLGLPHENYEDIEAIATLSEDILQAYFSIPKPERHGRPQLIVSTSFFVPKPFTPFQWVPQNTYVEFMEKQQFLDKKINKKHAKYNSHDAITSMLEGVIARGDRRIAKVLVKAYENGASFDAWSEHFHFANWEKAFEQTGIDPMFYASRERSLDEVLPWDFIDIGVKKSFLAEEYKRSLSGLITPNCMEDCMKCGANCYGGGICYDREN